MIFDAAARSARTAGDEAGLAKAVNNLALVHTELGTSPRHAPDFSRPGGRARACTTPASKAGALTNLGMLEVQLGAPRAAIPALVRARDLYRSIGYETGEQNVRRVSSARPSTR